MWKFIILVVIGYFAYKLVTNDMKKKSLKTEEENREKVQTGDMIKDPICGAYVSKETGYSVRDSDHIYSFCSTDCRDAFLKKIGFEKGK